MGNFIIIWFLVVNYKWVYITLGIFPMKTIGFALYDKRKILIKIQQYYFFIYEKIAF